MLIKFFQERVAQNPGKIAVKTKELEITYDALNLLSNAIAHAVCDRFGEEPESEMAALLFEHGIDMILGTLGALKADRVYVPFDPAYPENRLLFMLNHSEAALIITNNKNLKLAEALAENANRNIDILNIDDLGENINVADRDRKVKGERPAYLLYTSGSTGTPKGIIQNHQNVVYFVTNYIEQQGIKSSDRMTLFSAFSHDAAIIDIYSGLLSGATLYPLNVRQQICIEALYEWLDTEQITIWHSVPTLFRYFVNTLSGKEKPLKLRCIVLGGESVIEQDAEKVKRHFKGASLINLYGQSESSYNSSQKITDEMEFDGINLGEPIQDTRVLVINDKGSIASPFSVGEIVVASKHLALGYFRDQEKTDKAFEMHPELGRIYRTGDLGRFDEDGHIEYLGRKDFQIKIRGYRVELEEVENCLLKHGAIKESAVIGKKDEYGSIYLCGFFTADEELEIEEVREFLSKELPDYMIPSFLKRLDALPLTPTGKVDRKALLEMQQTAYTEREYEAPNSDMEKKLVLIWSELLGIDRIGINDNFFAMGGHSLKAFRLISEIHGKLGLELPLRELFKLPTIKELSRYLEGKKKSSYIAIEPIKALKNSTSQVYELSSAQNRMYILQQLDTNSTSYNIPNALIIQGALDVGKLNSVMQAVIKRHEVLRTSFEQLDGRLVQKIHPEVSFEILYEQAETGHDEEEIIKDKVNEFVRPFDIGQVPLLRASLVKLAHNKYLFLFDIHHIISDGLSLGILYEEISGLYNGNMLPDLRVQYKDYAAWQNNMLKTELLRRQENYWLENLSGEIPLLNIPTDYKRPFQKSYSGDTVHIALPMELGKAVKDMAEQNGATCYMAMLAAYNILLHKFTDQEDILVGTPSSGRRHTDTDKMVGMFVNTLVMRNTPNGGKTVKEFLAEVKENVLNAVENQDYPFEELVEKLNIQRDLSRNPLFDTFFSMQITAAEQSGSDDLKITPYAFEKKISKFDLSLIVIDSYSGINLSFEYCTSLFKRESITHLAHAYIKILEQMVTEQNMKITDITILQEEEKKRILYDFNNTCSWYPKDMTIHELFEMQVQRTPHDIAVIFGDTCLTYEMLNAKANQLARVLREKKCPS